jgi:catechol 2,3-dioxygenase-like lactoylglutathione lyase family enzyme
MSTRPPHKPTARQARTNEFRIISTDHTGITVSNLERSLAFWRDVLGFELSHTAHQKGELAREITGVEGAEIKLAVLKAPGGHKIELLEYLAPGDRKRSILRPCDGGFVHVALLVDDLDTMLERIAASGWNAAGKPQTLTKGPNAGKRVVYVRDPDGTTIEFMQPPIRSSKRRKVDWAARFAKYKPAGRKLSAKETKELWARLRD